MKKSYAPSDELIDDIIVIMTETKDPIMSIADVAKRVDFPRKEVYNAMYFLIENQTIRPMLGSRTRANYYGLDVRLTLLEKTLAKPAQGKLDTEPGLKGYAENMRRFMASCESTRR